jgi:LAO/AO transport system kinase
MDFAERIAAGDTRAGARLMRWLDDGDPRGFPVFESLYPGTGKARLIGVTGSPGAGKSTLIAAWIRSLRDRGHRVGVVAVDPSSPFTGGALLGDRVRMTHHALDPDVFIRSVATRGALGGLSSSAVMIAYVLDAMGFDRILLETVGVGQDEIDIMRHADATAVVLAPGHGDEVQAHKAGLLEIADVLVVNKSDLPDAEQAALQFEAAASMARPGTRIPVVVRTSARENRGVTELCDVVEHLLARQAARPDGTDPARVRLEDLVTDLVSKRARERIRSAIADDPDAMALMERVARREIDPFSAADILMERHLG